MTPSVPPSRDEEATTATETFIITAQGGIGYVASWPPITCGCGRVAAFAINRDGQTRCLECDAALESSRVR